MTTETPATNRTDTNEPTVLKVDEPGNALPAMTDAATASDPLRPEVRKAFERNWRRNEAAYRYLRR